MNKRAGAIVFAVIIIMAAIVCMMRLRAYLPDRDDMTFFAEDFAVHGANSTSLYIPHIRPEAGIYTVNVNCHTNRALVLLAESFPDGADKVEDTGSMRVTLLAGEDNRSFDFYAYGNPPDYSFTVTDYEDAAQSVPDELQITLRYQKERSVSYCLIRTLFPFVLLAAAYAAVILLRRKRDRELYVIIAVLTGITLIISLPLFAESVYESADTTYHIERIAYLKDALFNGDVQYRLQPGYYGGYGCPMGIFYGMLLMVPFAAMNQLGIPLWQCYQSYLGMINILTVSIGYYCFRRIAGSRYAGLYGCIVYTTSYWLFQRAYLTAGIGEFSTFPFLPLLLLGFYELFTDRFTASRTHLLIGYTMMLQTHLLTTVNATVVAALFCLVKIKQLLGSKRWLHLMITAVLTALVNLWMLVPYLDFSMHYDMSLEGYDTVLLIEQTIVELIKKFGWGQILALVLCVVYLIVETNEDRKKVLAILLGIAAIPLFLGTKYVPWGWIKTYLYPLYAVTGEKIQFAYRYLTVASPVVSAACAYAVGDKLPDKGGKTGWKELIVAGIALVCLITASDLSVKIANNYEGRRAINPVDRKEVIVDYRSGSDFFVYADIDLDAFVVSGIDRNIYVSGPGTVADIRRNGTTFELSVDNASGGEGETVLDFPVWYYNGYKAIGDGTNMAVSDGPGHRARVALPPGYSGRMKLYFAGPWFWQAADVISVSSIIMCLTLIFKRRRTVRLPHTDAGCGAAQSAL